MNNYSNHIAIIGAGIAGLALGIILKKNNINCVIFEKSKSISEYGAGISISPNGMKVLECMDLKSEFCKVSEQPKNTVFFQITKKLQTFSQKCEQPLEKIYTKFCLKNIYL